MCDNVSLVASSSLGVRLLCLCPGEFGVGSTKVEGTGRAPQPQLQDTRQQQHHQ